MHFWISGEVYHDVDKDYALASNAVSQALNAELGNVHYGIPVDSWNVIGVLLPASVSGFEEDSDYQPDKRNIYFRLRLHYHLFRSAESPEEREWIIFKMILRSVDLSREVIKMPSEVDKLRSDIVAVGKKHGWLERLCDDD
jgi:hypothetical protein